MNLRVLLVEDDPNLGKATEEGLKEKFAVDWVRSAEMADDALTTIGYELIVLDVNLPMASGLDLLSSIRKKGMQLPVLLLTARDTVQYKVDGLNAGADDYLVKPFDLDELLARCSALIRRSMGSGEASIRFKDFVFEPLSGKLTKSDGTIFLSHREKAVLEILARNIDRPVSKHKIEECIYDWASEEIESNTIEVYIAALRKKLGREIIVTIRNVGYMITK